MGMKETEFLFGGFVPFEHKLLIISYGNFLLEFNLENCTVNFSESVSAEICKVATKVDWFIQAGDNLVATSIWGNQVYLYDAPKNKWLVLDVGCHQKPWGNFLDVFWYNEDVYILPRYKEFLVKIDVEKRKVLQLACPVLTQVDKEKVVSCKKGQFIYLFEQYGRQVFIYDLKTKNHKQKELPDTIKDIVSIRIHKGVFYILSGCGRLDTWDEKDNVLQGIVEPFGEAGSNIFTDLAVTDRNIWLLPQLGDDIFIYDYKDRILERYEDYPANYAYADFTDYPKFAQGREYQDKIYFGMHSANHLLTIDKNTGMAEWLKPILPTTKETFFYRKKLGLSLLEDERKVSLEEYIEEIPQLDNAEMTYVCKEQTIGTEIWTTLKREGKEID